MEDFRTDNGSFWFASLGELARTPVAPAIPDSVDIAIIGAGYTGLWSAYYLKQAQPDLDIAIFEANGVGFGASGRNGGWCMGLAYGIQEMLADPAQRDAGRALLVAMHDTVDEVGRVSQRENIDCHYAKGGTLRVASTPHHIGVLKAGVARMRELGFTEDDYRWLPPAESMERIGITPNLGASYTPHCAAIHPARLVHGLAATVRAQGVAIFEGTPVHGYAPQRIELTGRTVKAECIIRATEGYTDSLRGERRKLLPLYSMVVATEPLPAPVWDVIGLRHRETFGDGRRRVIYGQRTEDDRLVFGGRAGYYFGSRIKPVISSDDPQVQSVSRTLRSLLPILHDYRVTHGWGGLMGVPRHWRPCVTFDPSSGIGSAGGYTGEGVAASNLAARILADLIGQRDTEITRLAWVDDHSRRWEPEPVRWLGARAVEYFARKADAEEFRTGRASRRWGGWFDRLSAGR